MRSGAKHYFYFLGTLIALECVGQALGRFLCAVFRKQVTANAMSSIVILIFGTVGGFMPPYSQIHIFLWGTHDRPILKLVIRQFHTFSGQFLCRGSQHWWESMAVTLWPSKNRFCTRKCHQGIQYLHLFFSLRSFSMFWASDWLNGTELGFLTRQDYPCRRWWNHFLWPPLRIYR